MTHTPWTEESFDISTACHSQTLSSVWKLLYAPHPLRTGPQESGVPFLRPDGRSALHLLRLFVAIQRLHIVGAFKGRRVGDGLLAHAAPHLLYRHILMFDEPAVELLQDLCNPAGAVHEKRGADLCHIRTCHQQLHNIPCSMHAACRGQTRFDFPNSTATQRSASGLRARCSGSHWHHLKRFDVQIGLIEPVEQYQSVGPRCVKAQCHVRHRAENGLSFIATGIFTEDFTAFRTSR